MDAIVTANGVALLAEAAPDVGTGATAADPAAEAANELLELFARDNRAVWPGHMIAYAVAVGVLALMLLRPGRTSDRVTTGALVGLWLWLGALYAAMFVVQAGVLLRAGVVRHRLRFPSGAGVAAWVGWAAIGYALVVYPLIGSALATGGRRVRCSAWRRVHPRSSRSACCSWWRRRCRRICW